MTVFAGSNPNYSSTQPVTSASIYKLAQDNGWTGEIPWLTPQPLTSKIEAHPYPLDALPERILEAVTEVHAFVKAPVPMVACSALAALSLAIQAHSDIQRAEKLSGPVGVFTLVIAESGERKSTCDGFFATPIRDYEAQQAEAAKPLVSEYKADLQAWDAKQGGIKDKLRQLAKDNKPTSDHEQALRDHEKNKPEAPQVPRMIYGDATPEALCWALSRWPTGGVLSSEAGSVLGSHGMSSDSAMRNLATLNQFWDGIELIFDRKTSDSYRVRARLTISLQIQEQTLRTFLTKTGTLARGSGFLARFLIAWPESTQGARPFTEAPTHWPHLAKFHQRITELLAQPVPMDADGGLTPKMLTLTPDAKAAWVEYYNAIEGLLCRGGELYDVRDVASKVADNVARLAALFHVFESGTGAVSLDAVERACRVASWHLSESQRFFGELAQPEDVADAGRLDTWLIAQSRATQGQSVSTRDAQRLGPVRDKEKLEGALRVLLELDRARVGMDGRRRVITLNPDLLRVTP